ncbi:Hypothetical protein SRAE_0000057300 [Strongyloides ratti]|uniref:Uncharacterized protein n=1 Tax=Strongyloides ratti TaxID=34506 RepID=A0A090L1S6_STRRB|nr:Hypothetical protein SRAE_0000057300 [Strongyloides ratti]CEF61449.1 Hypothetical protein SRAE_0000057300 [Strongyloides ratti]
MVLANGTNLETSGKSTSMPMELRDVNSNQETSTIPIIRNETPQTIVLFIKKQRGRPPKIEKSKNAVNEI